MNETQNSTYAIPEIVDVESTIPKAPTGRVLGTNMDLAVRMYAATGKSMNAVAKASNVSPEGLRMALKSQAGQQVLNDIRGELDTQFSALYKKVIRTVEEGLDHAETQVALASASLWLKYEKATKVEVSLSAEDVIQKIMSGEVAV